MENNELTHYGVLGMKWGKRRYQNKDGSLTPAGRKRVSEQYKREMNKVIKRTAFARQNEVYVESYNKAAKEMNEGGIDKFNKAQEKKYGKDFAKRDGYDEDLMKEFSERVDLLMRQRMSEIATTDKYYKRAEALVERYNMLEWDEVAKENHDEFKKYLNK